MPTGSVVAAAVTHATGPLGYGGDPLPTEQRP